MGRRKLTQEEKHERIHQRYCERIRREVEIEKNMLHVKKLVITIEWKKSRTWGSNPHAMGEVHYKNGLSSHHLVATCSGYGYDKESTVIAEIFNGCLKYKLWEKNPDYKYKPYGVNFSPETRGIPETRSFSGGIGTNCYYNIAEYIGGKFTHIASGSTFDVYEYIDNEEMPKLNNEEE